jgi:hypothetical protein
MLEPAWGLAIKPDLNTIYTSPPFTAAGGHDFGWFCREHAFHAHVVAWMLGIPSKIIRGDLAFRVGDLQVSTVDSGADHAWCSFNGTSPVDVSASFRYYPGFPALPLVRGAGVVGGSPFEVHYLQSSEEGRAQSLIEARDHTLVYIEREVLDLHPLELLRDPFTFVADPDPAPSFLDIYGADVFAAINLHCYKLVRGGTFPVHRKVATMKVNSPSQQDRVMNKAVKSILQANRDPWPEVERLLAGVRFA